jgi:hypothetical protein
MDYEGDGRREREEEGWREEGEEERPRHIDASKACINC